jgi:hypothetical protein
MVKKAGLVMAVVAGSFLAGTPSALAQEVPGAVAAGGLITATAPAANVGALSGNVIQIPGTVVIPVQVCDNNVATGIVAVAVGALHAGFCTS